MHFKKFKFFLVLFLIPLFLPVWSEDFQIDKKTMRAIRVMEVRHFQNKHENEDIMYRIEALEDYLFGTINVDYSLSKRIERLKIASQQKMLQGVSIPAGTGISRKKMKNNKITIKQSDDVGIFDGLMKLYAPDVYEFYKRKNERHLEYEN
ncbi:hypothetical protein IKA15_03595 [bacterium]|nr:hypothetical protein [bacterium]